MSENHDPGAPTPASGSHCPACGASLAEGARFCSACGAAVDPGPPPATADLALAGEEQPRGTTMPRWVPAVIAATLLAGIGGGLLIGLLTGGDDAGADPTTTTVSSAAATVPGSTEATSLSEGSSSTSASPTTTIGLPIEVGTPSVTGSPLPRLDESGTDSAIGMQAPRVAGTDWTGSPVSITNDGRAKMILFVAHWCPVCQNELPGVQDWVDSGGPPDGVDLYAVSTDVRTAEDNYPPSSWFEREAWTPPVVVDDGSGTVRSAFGLRAYPFWVFVGRDGAVTGRIAGGLSVGYLDAIAASLLEDSSPPPPSTTPAEVDPSAFGTVVVAGEDLPRQAQAAPDPAIGMPVPEVEGTAPDGGVVTIGNDGRAKIVMVVAHWCPYCRQEVPLVRDWLATGPLTDAVDFYTVATFTDAERDNFPPGPWLEGEELDTPIIFDDPDSAAARAFGVPAVPYWVLIGADGTLALRGSGALPVEALDSLVEFLVEGPQQDDS